MATKHSNWRDDLREVVDSGSEDQNDNEIREKKVKNKIDINPSIREAVAELGGQLIDMREESEVTPEYVKKKKDILRNIMDTIRQNRNRCRALGSKSGALEINYEADDYSQRDSELKKTSSARNQRYKTLHKKTGKGNVDVNEGIGGTGSLVRQGVKVGGKKGGRVVQAGQKKAIEGGRVVQQKVKQGNPSKMVGSGKFEKAGAMVGGVTGGIAGGVLDGPLPVGDIVGGIAGSKIGGKIGRQFDKRANTKKEQYSDWRSGVDIQELKFGEKGKTFFYNDPKARRDTLKQTGKDPGHVSGDAAISYTNNAIGGAVKSAGDYAVKNPGKAAAIGAGVVGAGLLAKKVLGGDKKKENKKKENGEGNEDVNEGKYANCKCSGCAPDGVGHQNPCVECGGHHKDKLSERLETFRGSHAERRKEKLEDNIKRINARMKYGKVAGDPDSRIGRKTYDKWQSDVKASLAKNKLRPGEVKRYDNVHQKWVSNKN